MSIAYLSLGSNLGDKQHYVDTAIAKLPGTVLAISQMYETEPVGCPNPEWYLNCAVKLETELAPEALLQSTQQIEHDLHRVRTVKNGPRTIDIDIIFYDDLVLDAPDLIIPHPRAHERRFVLQPLLNIAPDLGHPGLQRPISALLEGLPVDYEVRLKSS